MSTIENNVEEAKKLLLKYANQVGFLISQNKLLSDKITSYNDFISFIKETFSVITPNNSKEIVEKAIRFSISKHHSEIINKNLKLSEEIKKMKERYNNRYLNHKEEVDNLIEKYEKVKEDNFILENSIKEKESYLKKYHEDLENTKRNMGNRDDIREKYLLYSKNVNTEHLSELEKIQSLLAVESKEINKTKINTERLQTQIHTLRKNRAEGRQIAQTQRNQKVRPIFMEKEENNNLVEVPELDSFLLFKDFENDNSINTSKFDEYDIGLTDDFRYLKNFETEEINNQNNQNDQIDENEESNTHRIEESNAYLKQRVNTVTSTVSDHKKSQIPKLNLKQIEFNKVKVYAVQTDRKIIKNNNKSPKNKFYQSFEWKIITMKKKVIKERELNKKYKKTISNFKLHYLRMKEYIRQIMKMLNSFCDIDENEINEPCTERITH